MSNLRTTGYMQLRMAMNAAQHKIVNLLKTLCDFYMITCCNVFIMWPKTTLLLSVVAQRHQKAGHPFRRQADLRPRKSPYCIKSPKAGKNQPPQVKGTQAGRIPFPGEEDVTLFVLFRPSIHWMSPLTLGRVVCFTHSISSNIKLI